ncbi:MAG TPA: hypothetical protein VH088_14170 [Terriglobales bacterium]|nr:hypothetical protein [Terriglobales bacterium]
MRRIIEMVAAEMSAGVRVAVDSWMTQVEQALNDSRLNVTVRMNSVKKVVDQYRGMKGRLQRAV